MATYIECMRYAGDGFVALRADKIEAVYPVFGDDSDDFMCSRVHMSYGGVYVVNETWDQIAEAIEAEGFAVATKPLA